MTETEWLSCTLPTEMLHYLKKAWPRQAWFWQVARRRIFDRKLRLFLLACLRRNWSLLQNHQNREAVEVAERFADGLVNKAQLKVAQTASRAAARSNPDTVAQILAVIATEIAQTRFSHNFVIALYGAHLALWPTALRTEATDTEHPDYWSHDFSEPAAQANLLRDVFGNLFRPVRLDPSWLTSSVLPLARDIYESRTFDRLPILADALEDAGCENTDVLNHCRLEGSHVRGCWVIDLLMGQRG